MHKFDAYYALKQIGEAYKRRPKFGLERETGIFSHKGCILPRIYLTNLN